MGIDLWGDNSPMTLDEYRMFPERAERKGKPAQMNFDLPKEDLGGFAEELESERS